MVGSELLWHRAGVLDRHPESHALCVCGGVGNAERGSAQRHQAVCDAFGASANPWFQAVQDSQHRDTDVLMLYPLSLVACEERFGSWMVQYGYANYVTPRKLLQHGQRGNGWADRDGRAQVRHAGGAVRAVAAARAGGVSGSSLSASGGKLIWSGPPPRLDLSGQPVLGRWQKLFGVKALQFGVEGQDADGWQRPVLRHAGQGAVARDSHGLPG